MDGVRDGWGHAGEVYGDWRWSEIVGGMWMRWQMRHTMTHTTKLYGTILECPIHSEEKQLLPLRLVRSLVSAAQTLVEWYNQSPYWRWIFTYTFIRVSICIVLRLLSNIDCQRRLMLLFNTLGMLGAIY